MTGLNHVLTGSAIAIAVQQPLLVAPLAFLSHFVLDSLPHFGGHPAYEYGHKHFYKIMVTDGILAICAITILIFLAPQLGWVIVLGAAFATLPDFTLLHHYLNNRHQHWFHRFHLGIQWYERPPGAIVEATFCILMITILIGLLVR